MLLDPRLHSKIFVLDSSFTLGSTEEAKMSCNGLLLCSGFGRPVFDYIYNSSTNQYRKLPHPDCSLDNSPYYRSAGLRMAFDPTKSPHYKLVDVGSTSWKLFKSRGCLLFICRDDTGSSEFTIYEMMVGFFVWTVRYHVDTDDFMTPLLEGWSIWSTVWSIVLGEREQDSFLLIKLSSTVVQYNLILKTFHEIYDYGFNHLDDNHDDDDDEILQ
nr:hypothetical protein [Tanacetum cinerariifolium]